MSMNGIIIGSAPSSGSTLLVSTLGRASNIYQTDELYIFDKPDWIAQRTPDLKKNWAEYFRKGYPAHFAYESPLVFPYEDSAPGVTDFDGSYTDFCVSYMDAKARAQGFARWVEKTPTNIFAFPFLSDQLAEFKFIIIVRHPGSVLRSLAKRKMNPFIAAARVYYSMLVTANMTGRENVHLLKYEDLTADPSNTLQRTFDFIGERFDASYLTPEALKGIKLSSWQFSPSMGIVQQEEHLPKVASEHAFHLANIRASKNFMKYAGIERCFCFLELCDIFGYDVMSSSTSRFNIKPRLKWIEAYTKYAARSILSRRPIRNK